jgi:biopolymer transport protein TolR
MASIDTGGKGPNVDLNLVPFIDLMSVLITFLLISAIWVQVSLIQIGSSLYAKKTSDQDIELLPDMQIPFRVDVREEGYRIIIANQSVMIPKVRGEYDEDGLLARLMQIKASYPDKTDAVITMEDEIAYNELIRGMDMLIQAGFPSIAVATGGAI